MSSKTTGKKITNIKFNKEKVTIFFQKERLSIPNDIYPSFYLYIGKEISDKDLNQIKHQISLSLGFKEAKKILTRSLIPENKLIEKLTHKDIPYKNAKEITDFYVKNGVISDEAYIQDMLYYYEEKMYGEVRIKEDLYKRGIKKEDINKIIFKNSLEFKKAKEYLKILMVRYKNKDDIKDKIYNALLVRGFKSEIANELTSDFKNKVPQKDLKNIKEDYDKGMRLYSKKYQNKDLIMKIKDFLKRKGYKYNDIMNVIKENLYEID